MSALVCSQCNQPYSEPIVLPCGNSICRKDLVIFQNNICVFCDEDHSRASCPENKPIKRLAAKYNATKSNCAELSRNFKEIKSVEQAARTQIANHLKKLREDINSKKDFIKNYLNSLVENQHSQLLIQMTAVEQFYTSQIDLANKTRNLALENVIENLFSNNVKIYEKEWDQLNENHAQIKENTSQIINRFNNLKNSITKCYLESFDLNIKSIKYGEIKQGSIVNQIESLAINSGAGDINNNFVQIKQSNSSTAVDEDVYETVSEGNSSPPSLNTQKTPQQSQEILRLDNLEVVAGAPQIEQRMQVSNSYNDFINSSVLNDLVPLQNENYMSIDFQLPQHVG